MTDSMPDWGEPGSAGAVFVGADTHRDTVHVAVVDTHGRQLPDREVATTPHGYAAALRFAADYGPISAAGVEGCGSYGAGFAGFLTEHGNTEVCQVGCVNDLDRLDYCLRVRRGRAGARGGGWRSG